MTTPPIVSRRALFAAALAAFFRKHNGYLEDIRDDLRLGTLTLPPDLESFALEDVWISVDERLPEESAKVIATNGKWVDLCVLFHRTWLFYPNGDYELSPTHWQPLPPAPEQTKGDSQ